MLCNVHLPLKTRALQLKKVEQGLKYKQRSSLSFYWDCHMLIQLLTNRQGTLFMNTFRATGASRFTEWTLVFTWGWFYSRVLLSLYPCPMCCLIGNCCIFFMLVASGWPLLRFAHFTIISKLRKASLETRQTWAISRVQMFTVCFPQYLDSFFPPLDPLTSSSYSGKNTVDVYIISVLFDLCCNKWVYKII